MEWRGIYAISLPLLFSSLNLSDKISLCTDMFCCAPHGCVHRSANANSYSQCQSHPGVVDAQEVNTIFQVIALFQAYNAVNVPGGPIYNKRHE